MYKNYPIAFLVIYCEQNDSKKESYELIKQIRNIVKKRSDYFTFNHLIVHLIVNNIYEKDEIYFREASVTDPVFNILHYCAGYRLSDLFGKVFQYHNDYVNNKFSNMKEHIKVTPTKVLSIQQKQATVLVNADMFLRVKDYVKLTCFTLSSSKGSVNEGDYDQLDLFLDDFMKAISAEISGYIEKLKINIPIPEQSYMS